ncbi:MAG: ComEC/Rec2 family competence protein [Terriglobales bacterium]
MARAPAFLAAVAFAAGVWLGTAAWRPPVWWLMAAVACVVGAAFSRKSQRLAYALALLAVAALGAMASGARDPVDTSSNVALSPFLDGGEVVVTGHVLGDSTSRPHGQSTSEAVDIESECMTAIPASPPAKPAAAVVQTFHLADDGPSLYATIPRKQRKQRKKRATVSNSDKQTQEVANLPCVPGAAGIRLTVYPHDTGEDDDDESGAVRKFEYGERLRFVTRLRPPRNFGNPGAWDYVGYLRDRGIVAIGSARADRVQVMPGQVVTRLVDWRVRARRNVLERISELWPGRTGGLVAAMVIGDRSDLRRDVRNDFQRTGIYHILVVSGMNVGIIAAVVFWCLRRLRVSDILSSILTVLLSCGYALLTDGGAPILRATLTLAVYLGARLLYRERAALNAVGVAALVLLVADPRSLFDASFQLTFVSVVAIAGVAAPLLERSSLPYRRAVRQLDALAYDLTLPPRFAQFRLDLRLLEGKLARILPPFGKTAISFRKRVARYALLGGISGALNAFDLVTVSAVAQCALALPMAVYFHRAVVAGLPANLVAVPLTGILMPAAAAAVALSYLYTPLARPAVWIAARSLNAILGTIRIVGGWRASDWRIAAPDLWLAITCAVALAFCLWAVRRRRWMVVSGLTLLAVSAACVAFVAPRRQVRPGTLEVTAIDVGQADATLVVTPDGHTLLVDAAGSLGPFQSEFDFGEDVVSPYLWARGFTRLDAVALTHAHSDHIGGMATVLANFRPQQLWLGPNAPDPLLLNLRAAAKKFGVRVIERRTPDEFSFGGAGFRVLSPSPVWQLAEKVRNEDSMVMEVSYGANSAMITGDTDKKAERAMLPEHPKALLLHVAHNGSMTSTSEEFLDAVGPRFAVISVGARNQFRHPRPEILRRLAEHHIATYRTDSMGAVSFYLDGKEVTTRPFRR